MTSLQRVMNTLQGLATDRVPVFMVLGAYGGKLSHTGMKQLYSDPLAYVGGQIAVQDVLGPDMVLAAFDSSAIAEAYGGEVAWSDLQAPNMKKPAADDVQKALALPTPDPRHTKRLPGILEATRLLCDHYRGQVPVFAVVPGPCALPALMMGLEGWLEAVLFDPEKAQRLLEKSAEFFLEWTDALFEAGVTALVVAESVASAEVSPRALFETQFLPHLRRVFPRVKGPWVFHHGGGRLNPVLDLLPGLPGLIGVAVSSHDDLTEARQLIGPRLLLIGNLDNLSLPSWTAEQTRTKSLECLSKAAPFGPFILSTSGADVPLGTPLENLKALLGASQSYAQTLWITCGVLKAEVNKLLEVGSIQGQVMTLNSMLHMDPPQLEAVLGAAVVQASRTHRKVVLVYGDCCPRMHELVGQGQVLRIQAINCAQMLVGKPRYRELMHQHSFMLLPEWAARWQEVFQKELGLSHQVAYDLMREHRGELVYLDTGLVPLPTRDLEECSRYTGLSYRIEPVSLDTLLAGLLEAEAR